MKYCFAVTFLFISVLLLAQEGTRTVSGRLTASDGSPLPGVSITIKGTLTGTTTDVDGYYSLNAPIGSTLVFAFIGMKTREVEVTADNLNPVQGKGKTPASRKKQSKTITQPFIISPNTDSTQNGIAVLDDKTPVYISNYPTIDPQNIASIRSLNRVLNKKNRGIHTYKVKMYTESNNHRSKMQFTTSIGIERITQTPDLQNRYAQGESQGGTELWKGPDTQEIFSWGPLMRTLQFDGSNYSFDKNGMLTTTGSGKLATIYTAKNFFRTGVTASQNLLLSLRGPGQSTVLLEAGRKTRGGIIPGSKSAQNNFILQLKKLKINNNLSSDASLTYNYSDGTLVNRGANLSSITGAVWRTPVSFDNTNGLSLRTARHSTEASRLNDGTVRSQAPGLVDNPYGLVQELPDNENAKRLLATATIRYSPPLQFSLTINNSFDKQWSDAIFGMAPGLSGYIPGRLTQRNEKQTYFSTIISPSYRINSGYDEINAGISYQFNYQTRGLNRTDAFGFSADTWNNLYRGDSIIVYTQQRSRNIHEILWNINYTHGSWLVVRLANRSYFSNTLSSSRYTNFFPTIGAKINLQELVYIDPLYEWSVYGTFAQSLNEAPLVYSNWSYLSSQKSAQQYNTFYESAEILFNRGLSPETENKFEAGMKFNILNQLTADFTYYHYTTDNFIAPVWNGSSYQLLNAARVANQGINVSLGYTRYSDVIDWGASVRWSKYTSEVTRLYSSENYIPMAGFNTTAKVLAAGKPLGALYGTSYKRNDAGQVIIGDDGFPLVDQNLKMIGNPIPDWTAGLDMFIQWRRFRVSCLFDFKKGGDVWNGTRAALDYLGRSESSANERTVNNYIFEGIHEDGQVNTTPVSFYDPAQPIAANRWVRYGFTGVGESYIEDASWIRLSELMATYTVILPDKKIHEVRVSLIGTNLFLITPYSGVDPSSSLFGYTNGTGLDLFNVPATRTFTARVTIKI